MTLEGRQPLRALVIAQDFPWPTDTGSMLRLAAVIGALGTLGPVDLFATVLDVRDQPTDVPPSAPVARSATSVYPWRRLSPLERARLMVARDTLEVAFRRAPRLRADLDRFAQPPYDLVWVSKATTFVALGEPRLGPTVVDLDDLEDRKIRARLDDPSFALQYPPGPFGRVHAVLARAQAGLNAHHWSSLQRRIAASVEAVVVCSDLDRGRLPVPNAVVVPNGYDPPAAPVGRTEVSEAPTVLLQGVLIYPPNADAARWLAEDIAPRLRQLRPQVEVRLVGTNLGLGGLHDPPRVTLTGWVPDIVPELARADVVAVPVRFGSGTRVKILEAFAHRIPVVSTTLGAEGLEARHGEHLLLADTADDFAAACARLLDDRELRSRLVDNAHRLLVDRYTWAGAQAGIIELARRLTVTASAEPVAGRA